MTRSVRAILALVLLVSCVLRVGAQDATLSVSNESPTTADRITLDVAFTVAPGWTLDPFLPGARTALTEAGWTVVATTAQGPAAAGGHDNRAPIRHAFEIVCEPFLAGEYALPALTAVATNPEGGRQELTTDARTITVASVLPEGEEVRLPLSMPAEASTSSDTPADANAKPADLPLGQFRDLPSERRTPSAFLPLFGAAVAIGGAAFAIIAGARARSGAGCERPLDPVRTLRTLARDPNPDPALTDRCVRALASRNDLAPAHRASLDNLIARLETLRYAHNERRDDASSANAGSLAKEADRLANEIASRERSLPEVTPA